jgi:8-oxo-dGTP diphosphatase
MDTKKIEEQAKKDGIERFVVGAVVISNKSILFVKRAQDDFMGGIYELPSGKVDSGENLIGALKREILEETNLVIGDIIGLCDTFDYKSKSDIQTRQFNFVVSVDDASVLKLDPKEHDLSEWVKFDKIESSKILDDMMKSIAQKAVLVVTKDK